VHLRENPGYAYVLKTPPWSVTFLRR